MREEIAEYFNNKKFEGGLTYNGHPISLAAAIANIQVMMEDNILKHVNAIAPVFRRHLTDLGEKHPSVGDVRSIGLFGILELVRDRNTKEPMAPFNGTSLEMESLQESLLAQGLFLYTHWNTVLIIPPLIINEEELAEGFTTLDKALEITDVGVRS
jgi:taurine--2-oxoglutarate transaminase